ncbi:MAG: AAA family ATPase [Candidatus Kerfeldbacteria bacterium]|nr:AAA family ATPase [Candidatus Kerfeldbacteria bacterium]
MKLIFIYGPPAVGKLTVAKELTKLIGYRNLHNQLTVDLVLTLFDWGTPQYRRYVEKYRGEFLRLAIKHRVHGLIMTIAYCDKHDRARVRAYLRTVQRAGGKIFLVRLKCSRVELMRRVTDVFRRRHDKITSRKFLASVLREHDFKTPVPFAESLTIDTTRTSPAEAARLIVNHYGLTAKKS